MYQSIVVNGISFNNNSGFWITDTSGLGKPTVRQVDYNMPGKNFGIFVQALYAPRAFTLSGAILGTSTDDYIAKRDALYAACDSSLGEISITFTLANGRIMQIKAVCIGLDIPNQAGEVISANFTAQFKASYPFFVSPTIVTNNVSLPMGGGGTVPSPTMPSGLLGNSGGEVAIVNSGNAIYHPTARIYGPVNNPQLLNKALNLALLFNINLASGQYLDIDFKRQTIVDNFGTNQYAAKSGDWWYLVPGTNLIDFSASSFSSTALASIFSQDSWLAI